MPILDDDSNDQMMMIFETNHSPSLLLKRNFYYAFDLSLRSQRGVRFVVKEKKEERERGDVVVSSSAATLL